MIKKAYIEGPDGQVHLRICGETNKLPDLLCLHPAPFSGLAFTAIMPHLAKGRRVIAPDYPGHGGSNPYRADATIADYARTIAVVIEQISEGRPVDCFGFHTGCLVAVELALSAPASVRRLVLCDVPAMAPDERKQMLQDNAVPPGLTEDLQCLSSAWERGITRRIESQGMARSFAMFVEQLRHGEAMNAGFHAGFSSPIEERFAATKHPTTIIATQSGVLDPTRRAAHLIHSATLVERLDITRAVLDEAAEETAAEVLRALG